MYKITIEKVETVKELSGKDWTVIGKEGDKSEFGYTPEIIKDVSKQRVVYAQSVDDLDILKVILAVNSAKTELKE